MTTFGTRLRPINIKEGLFVLTSDSEVVMDTPIADYVGTKKLFKAGTTVKGTLWKEESTGNKTRKVVLVKEDLQGRYLINKNSLEPTTEAKVLAEISKKEIAALGDKIETILDESEDASRNVLNQSESVLEKEYFGFTGKQLLIATLGVIVLIKVFK